MEETEPCPRCGAPLPRAVAGALRTLLADERSRASGQPDLTGLAVRLVARLDHAGTPADDATLFADAFCAWAGMSPRVFVVAVQHLWADLGPGPMT